MLSVCELILQRQMPLEAEGTAVSPGPHREELILYRIYERFVANFYRMPQRLGSRCPEAARLACRAVNEHLPSMVPDLILQEPKTGRMIVLDTKFTAGSLVENQWENQSIDTSHLYPLYAYLRSQEQLSETHRMASGILLYPSAQYGLSENFQLQEHMIRMEYVDLTAPWQDVENYLLDLVGKF